MLCIHVSNSGEIQISHLAPDDETGGLSNDMTWDFEKIDAVQGHIRVPTTEFSIEIDGLWHGWMTTSHTTSISFVAKCVSVLYSYSGGRFSRLLRIAPDEMGQILGSKQREYFQQSMTINN